MHSPHPLLVTADKATDSLIMVVCGELFVSLASRMKIKRDGWALSALIGLNVPH